MAVAKQQQMQTGVSNQKKKQRLFGCFLNLDVDATLGTVKQKSRNKEAVVTAKTALQLIATT